MRCLRSGFEPFWMGGGVGSGFCCSCPLQFGRVELFLLMVASLLGTLFSPFVGVGSDEQHSSDMVVADPMMHRSISFFE